MRLSLVREPFDHPDYIFELKHDGFRVVAYELHQLPSTQQRRSKENCVLPFFGHGSPTQIGTEVETSLYLMAEPLKPQGEPDPAISRDSP